MQKVFHDRDCLHRPEFEGTGKPQHVVLMVLDKFDIDAIASDAVQHALIGRRVNPPIAAPPMSAIRGQKRLAQQPKKSGQRYPYRPACRS